ncbi:AAA family ATPase [Nannocystis sp. ILAH1]|uniref:AAA family ATPase n=1 Tax=Nannocystis sp. ILAH1 TaxID=2996789 RepID=UPI00227022F3|nr:AAA family ATPase [Nannocystis sp. ILAH1]MCY0989725.1 AAA family ATPase [Nannocystis sp. ILAH1]MCY0993636.1 AAA family ATPase [Nannocystis sp. ILAH1]
MALPSLEQSEETTREAFQTLLDAELPRTWKVARRDIEIAEDTRDGDRRQLLVRWSGGEIALPVRIRKDNINRSGRPEDSGHATGLGVWVSKSSGLVLWSNLEFGVRDAIRAKQRQVRLLVRNSFYERVLDDDPERNSRYGEQAREVAGESGLGNKSEIVCGTYDLESRSWSPVPGEVLRRFVTLALIKAHFYSFARTKIRGESLFKIEGSGLSNPADDEDNSVTDEPNELTSVAILADLLASTFTPLALTPENVLARLGAFECPPGVLERCCAALNAGKHLLLLGPPGTGKSTIAAALASQAHADGACGGEAKLATASADWSTYDTIGGWAQQADTRLAFREGIVTRALRERRWIVLDEVNRADIDKCFGELFTVLSGGTVVTAYTDADGREVMIGPGAEPYNFGPHIRLIATMNVRDKASLFRLSYAFMRRFAAVHVPGLDDDALRRLAQRAGESHGIAPDRWELAARVLSRAQGLGSAVDLGPALLLDLLQYAAQRPGASHQRALGEGVELLVFPQLEGAEDNHAQEAISRIERLFTEDDVRHELNTSLRSYFPHLRRP